MFNAAFPKRLQRHFGLTEYKHLMMSNLSESSRVASPEHLGVRVRHFASLHNLLQVLPAGDLTGQPAIRPRKGPLQT